MLEKVEIADFPDTDLIYTFIDRIPSDIADSILIEFTRHKMRARLKEQRENGLSGWNTAQCDNKDLKERLLSNVDRSDWLDVINLAAMLLARNNMFKEKYLGEK